MSINVTGGYYIFPSTGAGGSATILWSSGGTAANVLAGESYSLSSVTILNYSGGTVYSNIEQGQIKTLNPAIVQGASGDTVAELAPDGVYVLGSGITVNVIVQNSDGSFSTGYTENGTFVFPDSTGNTYNSSGELLTGFTVPAGFSSQTVIGDSLVRNIDDSYQVLIPSTSGHTIPNSIIFNELGQFLATIPATNGYIVNNSLIQSSGGTYQVSVPATSGHVIPNVIIVNENGDFKDSVQAAQVYEIPNYVLNNTSGETIETGFYPVDEIIVVPDLIVNNPNGQSETFVYSGNVYTSFSTSGNVFINNTVGQSLFAFTVGAGTTVTTVVDNSLVQNSALQTISSLPATSGLTVEDSLIQNSGGTYQVSIRMITI